MEEELDALQRIEDRLVATANEGLEAVLAKLLPKLVILSNKQPLLNKVVHIFSHLIKRVKSLQTPLPVEELLLLVKPSQLPCAPNFAVTFLDLFFERLRVRDDGSDDPAKMVRIVGLVLGGLAEWEPHSTQSNTLLWWLLQMLPWAGAGVGAAQEYQSVVMPLVADYLVDVCLAQTQIKRGDQVASIQPGLSLLRVQRLTVKCEAWTASDLKKYKIWIVEHVLSLGEVVVAAPVAAALAVILTADLDWAVVQHAVFKANGARSLLSLDNNPGPTLHFLFGLLLAEEELVLPRSPLRDEVKCALLRWVVKELPSRIPAVSRLGIRLFFQVAFKEDAVATPSGPSAPPFALSAPPSSSSASFPPAASLSSSSSSLRYRAQVLQMVDKLHEHLDAPSAAAVTAVLMQGVTNLLASPPKSSTINSHEMELKLAIYSIVERIARRTPAIAVLHGVAVTALLFKILDVEDPAVIAKLYAALGALRIAFQDHHHNHDASSSDVGGGGVLKMAGSLDDVLRRSRSAIEPKNRLAALQWTVSLHGHDEYALETLWLLADDPSGPISQEVALQFRIMRKASLASSLRAILSLLETKEAGSSSSSSSERPVATMELVHTAQVGLEALLLSHKHYEAGIATFTTADRWLEVSCTALGDDAVGGSLATAVSTLLVTVERAMGSHSVSMRLLQSSICALHACILLDNSAEIKTLVQSRTQLLLRALEVYEGKAELEKGEADISSRVAQILACACVGAESHTQNVLNLLEQPGDEGGFKLRCLGAVLEAIHFSSTSMTNGDTLARACANICRLLGETTRPSAQLAALEVLDGFVMRGMLAADSAGIQDTLFGIISSGPGPDLLLTPPFRSACVTSLSKFCMAQQPYPSGDAGFPSSVWQALKNMWATDIVLMRFSIAAALCRMVGHQQVLPPNSFPAIGEDADSFYSGLSLPLKDLLGKIEATVASAPGTCIKEKGTCAVILLVLTKHAQDLVSGASFVFSSRLIMHFVDMMLLLLRETDCCTQDVSSIGLCHLFAQAQKVSASLAGKVAEAVTAVLLRERRQAQPAGVSVAGETRASSQDGRGGDRSTREGESARRPIANVMHVDPLQAAAAIAAAELGIALPPAGGQSATNVNPNAAGSMAGPAADVGFGVYTTACKVARKTGDPAIVFAVMSLIRRDPSFGTGDTSAIFAVYKAPAARVEKDKVRTLMPTLFLFKHDPHPVIRDVMRSLWESLITAEFLPLMAGSLQAEILSYCQRHLTSTLWREREAACLALESFLPQKSFSLLRPVLSGLWLSGMSVLDDVRDTTRVAAIGFLKVLSELVLRACNPEESPSTVDDCVEIILPILLDKGLVASTPECRGCSLGIIVRIVKVARASLKDWLVRLIAVLVESMSALEPKTMQYMSFHTTRLNISDEELDGLRLQLMAASPMQEALDGCLQSLRTSLVQEVIVHLCAQLNRGVGLATRVAACKSLSFIAETFPSELGTMYGNKAFIGLVSSLLQASDMAISLKRSLLSGLGTLGKVVDASQLSSTLDNLLSMYLKIGREQASLAGVIAGCIQQLVNRCGERLVDDALWTKILACVYMGQFDQDEETRKTWLDVWSEVLSLSGAGTKAAALIRTLPLLARLTEGFIRDLKWARRVQGINIFTDMTRTLPAEKVAPHVACVVEALLHSIPGQVWLGQAQVLECLGELLAKCHENLSLVATAEAVLLHATEGDLEIVLTLQDSLVKKSQAFVGPEDSTCDGNSDVMEIAEFYGEYHVVPQAAAASTARWAISARGMVALLIHEASRGKDKDYKLSAVHAFSLLPWKKMTNCASEVLLDHLPMLLASIQVPPYFSAPRMASHLAAKQVPPPASASKQQGLERKPTTYKRPTSAMSLFGVRYGATASAPTALKLRARPQVSGPALPEPLVEKTQPATAAEVEMETELPSQEAEDEVDDKEGGKNLLSSSDPAFRVKLMEVIAAGLTGLTDGPPGDVATAIIDWVPTLFRTSEVWSIRLASLKMLLALLECRGTDQLLLAVLGAVEPGLADNKTKIKLQALSCLHRVLSQTPVSANVLLTAEKLLKLASASQTSPEVISLVNQIHKLLGLAKPSV